MSLEDFEELRLEETAVEGTNLRAPLALRLLNGDPGGYPGGCGNSVPRPPQLYFDFGKLAN